MPMALVNLAAHLKKTKPRREKGGKKAPGFDLILETKVGEKTAPGFFASREEWEKYFAFARLADGNPNPHCGPLKLQNQIVGGTGILMSEMNQAQPIKWTEKVDIIDVIIEPKPEGLFLIQFCMRVAVTEAQITPIVLMETLEVRINASHKQVPLDLPAGEKLKAKGTAGHTAESIAADVAETERKDAEARGELPGVNQRPDTLTEQEAAEKASQAAPASPARIPGQPQRPKSAPAH